ncbi:hypothetical protein F2Q70_00004981 [Brassica cretica]|nr:hypothetical protein F2Q70_00004981 [Brassica cretica]
MLQSTIDGGIGSSAQACSKEKFVPMKSVIRGERRKALTQSQKKNKVASSQSQKKKAAPTQSQKKKEKVTEDITDFDDELGEEGVDEDVIGEEEREERQRSDMWVDFKVVNKPNGKLKAACNNCRNEYAWQSHSHGTSGLRRHRVRCMYWISLKRAGAACSVKKCPDAFLCVQPAGRLVRDCAFWRGGIGPTFWRPQSART